MRMTVMILTAASMVTTARGAITVYVTNSGLGLCNGQTTSTTYSSGQDVTINLAPCCVRVNIVPDTNADDIGRYTFTGGASVVDFIIGRTGAINMGDTVNTQAGDDWEGMNLSGLNGVSRVSGGITGDLTNDLIADQIYRLDIGGAVRDDIRCVQNLGAAFVVEALEVATTGSVRCNDGNILRVRTTGANGIRGPVTADDGTINNVVTAGNGDLLANLSAPLGEIQNISIDGNIGSSGSLVTIAAGKDLGVSSPYICINLVEADEIWANIRANTTARGDLRRVTTRSGDYTGSIRFSSLQGTTSGTPGIDIAGDLDADITADDFVGRAIVIAGTVSSGSLIRIEEDLKDDAGIAQEFYIATGAGFAGELFINAGGATSSAWAGVVKIGSTSLSPDGQGRYTNVSSSLGGGAVGLVRFGLHGNECVPVHNANPDTASSVTMAFYGPVTWDSGFPFIVEWFNGFTWVDESTDWSVIAGKGTRNVTIQYDDGTAQIPVDRQYRVTPVTSGDNTLLCDDLLTATETPTAAFTYNFANFVSAP